jgi:phage baseplate assembly protein gpV
MNLIHEKIISVPVLVPQEIAISGYKVSAYSDMAGRSHFCFDVQLGAVAAGKTVKVELYSSALEAGTDAVKAGEVTFTAPVGGVTSHVIRVSGRVTALRGQYLGVQVTNGNATAALMASVLLLAEGAYSPEDTGGTTLVV